MSVLQTIDLKKYYGTKPNITRALDGVNFSVNDGEFVAVVYMGCFQSCKGSVGNRRRRFAIRRGRDACACKRDGISNRCTK